jgi:hypothetical protein
MWHRFPELVTWRLFLFRYILLWSLEAIIFCWLYEYRAFWDMALFIPATFIAYYFVTDTIGQMMSIIPLTRKFFGIGSEQKTKKQKIMRGVAIVLAIFLAFYMGVWFSFGANMMLDILKFATIKQ